MTATVMKTSEILDRAADLIEERGWTQGCGGWPGDDNGPRLCIEGGLLAAQGINSDDYFTLNALTACPAYRAVSAYLGDPFRLFDYNDDDGRTAAEVVAVLRACALIEAAKENAEAREPVTA